MKNKKEIGQRQQKFSYFGYISLTLGFGLIALYMGYFYFKNVWLISGCWKLVGYICVGTFIINEIKKWYIY